MTRLQLVIILFRTGLKRCVLFITLKPDVWVYYLEKKTTTYVTMKYKTFNRNVITPESLTFREQITEEYCRTKKNSNYGKIILEYKTL